MPDRDRSTESLSIEEVNRLYAWEWVALKVTRIDDEGVITHGEVLAHTRQRGRLTKVIARLHKEEPAAHVYIFLGGTRHVSGDEFRQAIEEAARRDYVNARW